MRVLSLGAGVQSSTLLLMALHGDFETVPDYAIFADTGWEPRAVYEWLDYLEAQSEGRVPVLRVSNGNIRQALTAPVGSRQRFASVPFFLQQPDGAVGIGRRQCTSDYKILPIQRECRRLLGKGPKERIPADAVEQWIGISLDEAHRMKPSRVAWITQRWPLIERRMTRHDCTRWLTGHGYPLPPKSSCIGCPFHGNDTWRRMRDEDPEAWADAVLVDRTIRSGGTQKEKDLRGKQFMHRSLRPLEEVDLSTPADHGQGDLFGNECEGLCGV